MGEFSAGKSILINAIFGQDILPVDVTPTTSSITQICVAELGQPECFAIVEDDGTRRETSLAEFKAIAAGESSGTVAAVVPSATTSLRGVTLIDTPGLASMQQTHTDTTFGHLPLLDGAIICVDAAHGGLRRSVIEFLSSPAVKQFPGRFGVALCKGDVLVSASDRDRVRDKVTRQLARSLSPPFRGTKPVNP